MNNKYKINTDENKAFLEKMRNELLCFGKEFPSEKGSSYYLGEDGKPLKDRNRETWITSRMAHVYSIGTFLNDSQSKELATKAICGLKDELHDPKNGGYYAGLTKDGAIVPTKQCYAHAFVILAGCSGVLADIPGAKELLADALEVYDRYFWDEKAGLASDTWNTEFTVCDPYRGLNANMHSVEAFLAVYDTLGDKRYYERAKRVIDQVLSWAKANDWRIPEHYTSDWQMDLECNRDNPADQFKPYGATPGHGIEWARLITQWALAGKEDTHYIESAQALFKRAIEDGWFADGAKGIVYTTDWQGKPIVHDRMHWTLAEAINTSATLYKVVGKQEYADLYAQFMQYLDECVYDHKYGSWYHQLDRENKVIGTVWDGKPDLYHAFQATLIPYHSPSVSIAKAVKENL